MSETEEKNESEGKQKVKKKNLSLFDITTMIHPRSASIASQPHNVSNGSAMIVPESTKEKQKRVNFVTDIKNFGLFHRRSKTNSTEQSTNKIYTVSEEVSRQQVEEQCEKATELEEEKLPLSCELSVQSLNEECTLTESKQNNSETLNSQSEENACSSENEKTEVQDSCTSPQKDCLDKEWDVRSDSDTKHEAVEQGDYITRL